VDVGNVPRTSNAYHQNKWEMTKQIVQRMKKWEHYIMRFDNANRRSYILRLDRDNLISETFFADVLSFEPIPQNYLLPSDIAEPVSQRYLQVAKFHNPDETNSQYFMIVNRRCSPIDTADLDRVNGRRSVTIKLDSASSQFAGFNNWSIFDLEKDSLIKTFNKNVKSTVDLGWYNPGQGKLYKIAPVMQEGGTLVTNEDCSGEFDCKGEVNNNGYDINIRPGTTIIFTNSSARIIMTEGDFKSGITPSENTSPVYLKGKNGNFWKGLQFQNCPSVEIVRTYFENISPYELDSTYAADIINCGFVNINSCSFRSELDINAGGVRASFTTDDGLDIEAYILNNYFEMDAGNIPALSVITSGYVSFPVIIEGNQFESYTGNSSNAILLSGVVGGAIKENQITGFKNGIILIWSSMDFYGNNINGGDEDSKGVLSYASSNANLAPDGSSYTGGFNTIGCEGENAKCIDVDNSFLLLNNGYNTFDLKNYEPGDAYHLSGAITDEAYKDPLDATLNCFKVSETDTDAVHNMTWTSSGPINYNFLEYYCGDNSEEGMIAFDLGHEMYDTIYTESSGSGGGVSNDQSVKNIEIISVESLEDSVSINIRKRDYERVSELCHELLDDYIDSIESSSIVAKLYLAELRLDSAGSRISNLKSYLEILILNNPEKELLVKQAFYIIQKCKVALGLYESAMTGFQQIINQNPYSYEGLVASWDYAATSLLDSLHGTGGAVSSYPEETSKFQITNNDFTNNEYTNNEPIDDPKDKYDKKTFTKDDRKVIKENVFNSYKTSREKEVEIIKSLETKVAEGNASESEKNELKIKTVLSEIVKAKEPADIAEHIKIVNDNIQLLFGSGNNSHGEKDIKSIIPTKYYLSQNYPNPFNPITKISFDLPNDAKVKLIVYDLLGREIKSIVNNVLTTGKYTFEFDGSNLASGVYFYRLVAGDFTAVKRMVLVK